MPPTPSAPPPPPPSTPRPAPRAGDRHKPAPKASPPKPQPAPRPVTADPYWNRWGWKRPGLYNGLLSMLLGVLLLGINAHDISTTGYYGVKSTMMGSVALFIGLAMAVWPYGNGGPRAEQLLVYGAAAVIGFAGGLGWMPGVLASVVGY